MTEHTVTRTVTRVEEHTISDDGLYVVDIDVVKASEGRYKCTCGDVLDSPEDVEEHLS